jgi:alkylation response protein AidB-like acyl-CoA dehydrogenase
LGVVLFSTMKPLTWLSARSRAQMIEISHQGALGSEQQKQKWLPPMARMEKIGCFGLTEPLVGSGTGGGLTTTAKREGDTWVLNGQKRWIGTYYAHLEGPSRRRRRR